MDCANVTKIPTLPSAKRYFPPPNEHALYKDNFATGNAELSKVIADIAQRDGNVAKCGFRISWTLNKNAHKSKVKHASWSNSCCLWCTVLRAVCNASLLFLFFAINCQRKAQQALYFGISLASPSSNKPRIGWIAREHVLIPVFYEVQLMN